MRKKRKRLKISGAQKMKELWQKQKCSVTCPIAILQPTLYYTELTAEKANKKN